MTYKDILNKLRALADSKTAKWIASDAMRKLTSESVQRRLKKKSERQT